MSVRVAPLTQLACEVEVLGSLADLGVQLNLPQPPAPAEPGTLIAGDWGDTSPEVTLRTGDWAGVASLHDLISGNWGTT